MQKYQCFYLWSTVHIRVYINHTQNCRNKPRDQFHQFWNSVSELSYWSRIWRRIQNFFYFESIISKTESGAFTFCGISRLQWSSQKMAERQERVIVYAHLIQGDDFRIELCWSTEQWHNSSEMKWHSTSVKFIVSLSIHKESNIINSVQVVT